ncbi:histidine phosphatase family protein [Lacticaseibacillus daqingensis]|uniref:histidine phosphatase family protein n=1 Tax=Lacticaseibacillus daqingensis TaxID=2486014 RepID=UPI000F7B8242|nr:histidine phosphatase family protein [Lacticaseibacillus daqingensis]
MTVHLYLVRHGETLMNKAQRLQGFSDAPLTDKGTASAARLGALLAPTHFDAAYSSDRNRAMTTAKYILAQQPDAPMLHTSSGLREYYFGGLEGVTNAQLVRRSIQRYGALTMARVWTGADKFAQLIRNFQRMDDTGQAESLPALLARVRAAMQAIVAATPDGGNVLVVAHGVILSALVYQLDASKLPTTLLKNTSVTRIDVTGTDWQVLGVNLTAKRALLALNGAPATSDQASRADD